MACGKPSVLIWHRIKNSRSHASILFTPLTALPRRKLQHNEISILTIARMSFPVSQRKAKVTKVYSTRNNHGHPYTALAMTS